jgi:hypothetical protein
MAYVLEDGSSKWNESKWAHWRERVAQAQAKLDAENRERRARGQPPRVVGEGERTLVRAYFPDEPMPPDHTWYAYSSQEMFDAFVNMYRRHTPMQPAVSAGIFRGKSARSPFSINVLNPLDNK